MKITVFEARAFAFNTLREKIPAMKNIDMVFSLDDQENNKIIAALAKGLPRGLCILKLVQFGIANNYEDGKRMVENALGLNYISLSEYK